MHALRLAEALAERGHDVELWALSADGARFFREPRVPAHLVPVERRPGEDVEPRILRYAATLAEGLRAAGPADVHHAEDCLSARSLLALRAEGRVPAVVRTVHHVDDFASPVLRGVPAGVDRGRRPPHLRQPPLGRACCARDHGVGADVIPNGVDAAALRGLPARPRGGRRAAGLGRRGPTVLAIGGIEPRKGSRTLLAAFAAAPRRTSARAPCWRSRAARRSSTTPTTARPGRTTPPALGLRVHRGPAPPARTPTWPVLGPLADDRHAGALSAPPTCFAFPSEREGFGLVVLEAQAAGLPGGGQRPAGAARAPAATGATAGWCRSATPSALAAALVAGDGRGTCARAWRDGGRATAAPLHLGRRRRGARARSTGGVACRCVTSHEYAVWTRRVDGRAGGRRLGARARDPGGRAARVRRRRTPGRCPPSCSRRRWPPASASRSPGRRASGASSSATWRSRCSRTARSASPATARYDLWVHSSTPAAELAPGGRARQALLLGHEHARTPAGDPLPPGRAGSGSVALAERRRGGDEHGPATSASSAAGPPASARPRWPSARTRTPRSSSAPSTRTSPTRRAASPTCSAARSRTSSASSSPARRTTPTPASTCARETVGHRGRRRERAR